MGYESAIVVAFLVLAIVACIVCCIWFLFAVCTEMYMRRMDERTLRILSKLLDDEDEGGEE
jgi:threonine/homoserine/homoserine lactone efflux protein